MANAGELAKLSLAIAENTNRAVFETLFDTTVSSQVPDGLRFRAIAMLRERQSPGLSGREKDAADFLDALTYASDNQRLLPLVIACLERSDASSQQENITVAFQSVINLKETFQGAGIVNGRAVVALRRCCLIVCTREFDTPVKGSGFLIGPNLVLTNWHVMRSKIDPAAKRPTPDSHNEIEVTFDLIETSDGSPPRVDRYRPVREWLVAMSPGHLEELVAAQKASQSPWPADPNELDNFLDFAIIELDGAPGYDRGHYDLTKCLWPQGNGNVNVFQFPMGLAMCVTQGTLIAPTEFRDNAKPPCILHTANTIRGSSGGLCADSGMAPVALHQGALVFKQGEFRGQHHEVALSNVAIPLVRIAIAARPEIDARIAAAPRRLLFSQDRRPIVGRSQLQTHIDNAVRGATPIVSVLTSLEPADRKPRTKIGKSYSVEIMKALLWNSEHTLAIVQARRLSSDPFRAAREIVSQIDATRTAEVPEAPSPHLNEDDINRLVRVTLRVMRAAAGNGVLWLVIDDLDRSPIDARWASATYLNALYRAMAADQKMRVVLIGVLSEPDALKDLSIGRDRVEAHLTDDDVAKWIGAVRGPDRQLPADLSLTIAQVARSVSTHEATREAVGPSAAIADVLRSHIAPYFRQRADG